MTPQEAYVTALEGALQGLATQAADSIQKMPNGLYRCHGCKYWLNDNLTGHDDGCLVPAILEAAAVVQVAKPAPGKVLIGRCKECRHWDTLKGEFGLCLHTKIGNPPVGLDDSLCVMSLQECGVQTRKNFGCIHWAAKEGGGQ